MNSGILTLSSLTISNGSVAAFGGGIDSGGTLTVNNCIFSNNVATGPNVAGAIFVNNNASSLTITGSTFSNNSAYTGGAIYTQTSTSISNSTFSGNQATGAGGSGGAIADSPPSSMLAISNSTFYNNSANSSGGAIGNIVPMTITNSTFENNATASFGGGIFNSSASATITSSTFSNNSATAFGGGAVSDESATMNINNSVLAASLTLGTVTGRSRSAATVASTSPTMPHVDSAQALARMVKPSATMSILCSAPVDSPTTADRPKPSPCKRPVPRSMRYRSLTALRPISAAIRGPTPRAVRTTPAI